MIINQGVPIHDFYSIVVPPSFIKPSMEELSRDYKKPIQQFRDPHTKQLFEAEIHGVSTLTLYEFLGQSMPALMAYGHPPDVVANELFRSYPEILKEKLMRYIVLKKL